MRLFYAGLRIDVSAEVGEAVLELADVAAHRIHYRDSPSDSGATVPKPYAVGGTESVYLSGYLADGEEELVHFTVGAGIPIAGVVIPRERPHPSRTDED